MNQHRSLIWLCTLAAMIPAATLLSSCTSTRDAAQPVPIDSNRSGALTDDFDFVDMRQISQSIADDMIATFLGRLSAPPIMMISSIENHTRQYVDTKALTDRIRTEITRSGQAQFINEARRTGLLKNMNLDAASASQDVMASIARQLGARYTITGSLVETDESRPRQTRASQARESYYKLTLRVTDLKTGDVAWTKDRDFTRATSLPLIGW